MNNTLWCLKVKDKNYHWRTIYSYKIDEVHIDDNIAEVYIDDGNGEFRSFRYYVDDILEDFMTAIRYGQLNGFVDLRKFEGRYFGGCFS